MRTMTELTCSVCEEKFLRRAAEHNYRLKENPNYKPTCGKECLKQLQRVSQIIACEQCGKQVSKTPGELKDGAHHFCSQSCAAKYSNAHRGYVAPDDKQCSCIDCGTMQTVNGHTNPKIVKCEDCTIKRKTRSGNITARLPAIRTKGLSPNCLGCDKPFPSEEIVRSNKQYCDPCYTIKRQEAGRKSAQTQSNERRSKNEIHFANLCIDKFNSVETNAAIFTSKNGKWDADVIIHDHKVAVLWNGVWHYKKITDKHSVSQVQNRDKIKVGVIEANGYTPYVVADMGKENRAFVEVEFAKFVEFIETLKQSQVVAS